MSSNFEDLHQFFKMFNVRIDKDVEIQKKSAWSRILARYDSSQSKTATEQSNYEKGYQLTIAISQLERLVSMLKNKGYYHDDDYAVRLQEEDLIMEHPELKQLHDQYKTLLYLLAEQNQKIESFL